MSGLGFLQAPCLTFATFQGSRMHSAKTSMNGRITKRDTVRAELPTDDVQRVCPKLTIPEVPYVDEVVKKLSQSRDAFRKTESQNLSLEESYEKCRIFCTEREKMLISVLRHCKIEQQRGVWALYALGRRIDDSVDSTNDESMRSEYLDQWEARTNDIFNGRPHDIFDVALVDTISKFQLEIKLFEDMFKAMRMDVTKKRFVNFEELFQYSYFASGAYGLMYLQIVGIDPESTMPTQSIYHGVIYSCVAGQLTDILKDVAEDAELGRIYFPQDELAHFGVTDDDIISKRVTPGYREFMKQQIDRVRFYHDLGKPGVSQLDKSCRSRTLTGLMMYKHVLDQIEEYDYDNLNNQVSEMMF